MKLTGKTFATAFLVFMLIGVKAWGAVCLADQAGSSPSLPMAQAMQLLAMSSEHGPDGEGSDRKAARDCLTACVTDATLTLSVDESGIETYRAQPVALTASLPIAHVRDFSDRKMRPALHRDLPGQNILSRTQRTRC